MTHVVWPDRPAEEQGRYEQLVTALGHSFDIRSLSDRARYVLGRLAASDELTVDGVVELLRAARVLEGVRAASNETAARRRRNTRVTPSEGQLTIDDMSGGAA